MGLVKVFCQIFCLQDILSKYIHTQYSVPLYITYLYYLQYIKKKKSLVQWTYRVHAVLQNSFASIEVGWV